MFCRTVKLFWKNIASSSPVNRKLIRSIRLSQNEKSVFSLNGVRVCQPFSSSAGPTASPITEEVDVDANSEGSRIKRRSVKDIVNSGLPEEQVRMQGWVKAFRKLKENIFMEISDGSSEHRLTVVVKASETAKDLNMHTAVDVTGVLQRNPKNPSILEIHPTSPVTLVGGCDQKLYPFGGKIRYTPEYIRQYFHLRPKTNRFSSMLRLRSETSRAVSDYFTNNGFHQIQVPILTSSDCEGAGETFIVKPESKGLIKEMRSQDSEGEAKPSQSDEEVYFNKQVHLSVSGQLHLECAAAGLDKVWTLSPVFRAENSKSTRHLSEFYMVEAELAFSNDIEQILGVMEGLVKSCVRKVLSDCIGDWNIQTNGEEFQLSLRKILDDILKYPFTVITFEEASNLLKDKKSSVVAPGKGLSREQELILVEELNGNKPMFVIDWPAEIKPFYMRECSYDPTKVSAVDLLVPTVGELCGGSLREADVIKLTSKLDAMDPSGKLKESLDWYIDLRKYGGSPTGGFGLGFDRLIQLITGNGNIKNVNPFPRWAHHCSM